MHLHRTFLTLFAAIAIAASLAATADARWRQIPSPVMRPTIPWEEYAVQEPTVMWDHGRYRLWYTGGWTACYLGYAESIDGIHWAKWDRPLLSNACHNNVAKINGRYVFYTVTFKGDAIQIANSRDGIHIGPRRTILRLRKNSWDNKFFANTFVWKDGGDWTLMYEARFTNWQTAIVHGNPHGYWPHAPAPAALGLGNGGMAGGPWRDGNCLYFHASRTPDPLPTDIYRRCGPMDHLGPAVKVLSRQFSWQVDQVADPTIARRPGHAPLMLFDAMDNPHGLGYIGAAFETR